MKKSLSHLPPHKRNELKTIVSVICDAAKVEKIILFGSYARGDWVEDTYTEGHITYEYMSDFDVLVVVKKPSIAHADVLWRKVERQIEKNDKIKTDVSIIVHDINEVNKKLSKGHYFFTDIKAEGVLLYDTGNFRFARRRRLSPKERQKDAEKDFKNWFKSAKEFFDNYNINLEKRRYKNAAFQLHQATERFYAATLLVHTHYKPKLHDLQKLNRRAICCDINIKKIFPRKTEWEIRCFNLLRRAYTEARYNPAYRIGKKELEYLGERVKKLQNRTRKACKEKIGSFA